MNPRFGRTILCILLNRVVLDPIYFSKLSMISAGEPYWTNFSYAQMPISFG